MISLLVACGDGSASLVKTERNTYGAVFDHAEQYPHSDYLISSGQIMATGIRIEKTELFDAAHWFATGERKSVGFVHVIEVTKEYAA